MYTLPKLPYSYGALEPYINVETMRIHHSKHHQAYVNKLNETLENFPELTKLPVEELLKDSLSKVPQDVRTGVRKHGGGHANHSFFWQVMGSNSHHLPEGRLAEALKKFGSFSDLQQKFTNAAMGQFGSGWAWLVVDGQGRLEIMSTANQDSPLSKGKIPILGVDVWEHAYYLVYQNRRLDYLQAFWKVVNWNQVEKNFQEATGSK